jgi:glycosyltransferase involved in cell wall biosynthesis
MQNKTLSIITVVLNGEEFIEQTIQSVVSQKTSDVEYIIIDGGSTDKTLSLIEKYKNQIDYWESSQDGGIYEAKTNGLRHCNGRYVGFISADDYYLPDALSKALEHISNFNADIFYGDLDLVSREKNPQKIYTMHGDHTQLTKEMSVPFPTCFVSINLYKSYPFDKKFRIASDYDFILGQFQKGAIFHKIPHSLAQMRLGGISNLRTFQTLREVRKIRIRNGISVFSAWGKWFKQTLAIKLRGR